MGKGFDRRLQVMRSAPMKTAVALAPVMILVAASGCLSIPAPSSESTLASAPALSATIKNASQDGIPSGDWPGGKWWEAFGDPGLNALVERAQSGSPDIKTAQARARLAMNIAMASGATTKPKIATGAGLMGQRFSENSWLPTEFITNPMYQADISADLAWNLDLWGAARLAAEGKIGAHNAAEAEAQAVRLAVTTAVARGWLRYAGVRELAGIAREALASRMESLALAQKKAERGLETQLNVERARFAALIVEDALASLAGAEEQERNHLAALAGLGPDEGALLPEPAAALQIPAALPENVPLDLVRRRPEIAAAKWRVEAAAKNIGAARAAFYPNVNLRALAGLQSIALDKLLAAGSLTYTASAAVHLPLYDGGALSGNLGAAHAEYDMAVERYNQALVTAAKETADAIAQINAIGRQMEIAGRALATAKKIHELVLARFNKGLDDYMTALKAQDDVFEQARKSAQLKSAMAAARVALCAALGGGFFDNQTISVEAGGK